MSYSTGDVARKIGVSKLTLLRWLYAGKLKEPKRYANAGFEARLWSKQDLIRARKYKEANYRKGRGRKKKA